MTAPQGEFVVSTVLAAPPDVVHDAFVRGAMRRRWLRLPGRPGEAQPDVDWAVGTVETLRASLVVGDVVERLERTTHVLDLEPPHGIAFAYRAEVDPRAAWVSLVTVDIAPDGDGSLLTWTERFSFLRTGNGNTETGTNDDHAPHLRLGTQLQLNGLAVSLGLTPQPARER